MESWLWKESLLYSSKQDDLAVEAPNYTKDQALTQGWSRQSDLLSKLCGGGDDAMLPLVRCTPAVGIPYQKLLADQNHYCQRLQASRSTGRKQLALDPSSLNISQRDKFLTECTRLFYQYAQCQALPQTPMGPSEDEEETTRYFVDNDTFGRILMELLPATVKQDFESYMASGGLQGQAEYGAQDFITKCFELCPYPDQGPPPLPNHQHHPQPAPPPQHVKAPPPKAAKWISNPRREEADPDVVIECAKKVHRERRKTKEARERLFKNIFERLHEKPLQKTKVNACMRPDRQDPFVKCGRTRLQGLCNRKKRKHWESMARNLVSGVDQMSLHLTEQQIQREKHLEAQTSGERLRLLKEDRTQSRARLHTAQETKIQQRRDEYKQSQWEMQEALRAVSTANADRVESLRRSKKVFHLSEYTSSMIPVDDTITTMKKAATKLSQWQKVMELEAIRVDDIRSSRLSSYRQATRGALDGTLRAQVKLPYIESQQTLDGSHVFLLTDEDRAFPSRASTGACRWYTRQRDVPSPTSTSYMVIGNHRPDGVTIPLAMKASQRVFRGYLNRPKTSNLSLSDYFKMKKEAQKTRQQTG